MDWFILHSEVLFTGSLRSMLFHPIPFYSATALDSPQLTAGKIFIPSSEMPFFCLNDSTFFSFYLAQKENFFFSLFLLFLVACLIHCVLSLSLSFFFFCFLVTMLSAHLKNKCIIKIIQNKCMLENNNGFDPWVGKIPWRREWLPTPVFLPEEFHGQRSLMGYCPWGCKETDTTERLTLKIIKG